MHFIGSGGSGSSSFASSGQRSLYFVGSTFTPYVLQRSAPLGMCTCYTTSKDTRVYTPHSQIGANGTTASAGRFARTRV